MITVVLDDGTQVDVSNFDVEEFPCPECSHWLLLDRANIRNLRATQTNQNSAQT
jgi:hypothetical protein